MSDYGRDISNGPSQTGASAIATRPVGLFVIPAFAFAKILLHCAGIHRYGYERDELYFIACAKRLAWGYVDHPPLVPWLTRLTGETLGYSLVALRVLPIAALTSALVLVLLTVRRLGGGRTALTLTGLSFLFAPLYLRIGTFVNIPAYELFLWSVQVYLLVVLIQTGNARIWLAIGFVAGLGLLNKHSMLFFGAALTLALVLTQHRRYLRDKYLWLGGAMAIAVFSPNLIWQIRNGYPTVEFLRNLNRDVMSQVSRVEFVVGQLLYMQPFVIVVCLCGLIWLLRSKASAPYRILGVMFLTVVAILLLTRSKVYYLGPAYVLVLSAGGLAVEQWTSKRRWLRPVLAIPLVAIGLLFTPLALPIMPIKELDAAIPKYSTGLIDDPFELTEHFHKEFGWEYQAKIMSRVVGTLSNDQYEQAVILTGNYGEAGAIEFFGPELDLPPVICGHHTYYLWGPGDATGETVIAYGIPKETLDEVWGDVSQVADMNHPQAIPLERNVPIYVCTQPRMPLAEAWPKFKTYTRIN